MPERPTARTRTVRWTDPKAFAEPIRRMSGLEFMRAFLAADLPTPPFMDLLGVRITSVEPGSVAFEFDPAEFMYSPLGTVHGGLLTVLLDTAMGCSVHTTLPAGVGYTTLELKVNFLRPVTADTGRLRAVGRVVHGGSRTAVADAELADPAGRVHARATSTLLLVRASASDRHPGSSAGD